MTLHRAGEQKRSSRRREDCHLPHGGQLPIVTRCPCHHSNGLSLIHSIEPQRQPVNTRLSSDPNVRPLAGGWCSPPRPLSACRRTSLVASWLRACHRGFTPCAKVAGLTDAMDPSGRHRAGTSRRRNRRNSRRGRRFDHVGIASSPGSWWAGGGPAGRTQGLRLGRQPGGQVADLLCDSHRMVAETLVIATDEGRVHCLFHAV